MSVYVPRDRIEIAGSSREFVRVPVRYEYAAGPLDPTGGVVEFQFPAEGVTPNGGGWLAGHWEPDQTEAPWYARILVGPGGGTVIAAGTWDIWLRVATPSELVVRPAGKLVVF